MNPERWRQIKATFEEVLQLEPASRASFIDDIGIADADLGRKIKWLLAQHEYDSEEYLEDPAVALGLYEDGLNTDSVIGKHIGSYELVRELGSGGMGEVYLAKRIDAEFDQRVAVKLIRDGNASAAVVSRFKSERRILAALEHPNIAKLLDGGRTPEGQPFFVMEYVPGKPITEYCEDERLDIPTRLALLIQICDGVQYAHQNAIIHRDLKPSNILVMEVDGKPVPRIIDFGLAKATAATPAEQTQLTRYGVFMGTPGFMSPEQADLRVRNVDTRTDVYSLGAILYVLLTGLQPFETAERRLPPFDEWLRRLREEEPPLPSVKLKGRQRVLARPGAGEVPAAPRGDQMPGDLDRITMKALERDRERRYATPAELAADLRRYLRHEPIMARPASPAYQIQLYVRRHRVAAGAALAVVFALSVGLAIALWQARVAGAAAREAHAQELKARAQADGLRRMSALSAEQAGDAVSQLGFAAAAVARLAYAVRLDPDNPTLRSHLLQLMEEQDIWWLPRGPGFKHANAALVQLSPDGRRLVTGSDDGTGMLWDTESSRRIGATMHHAAAIRVSNFSRDGRYLVTGSADRTARVWDTATGEPVGPVLSHAGAVNDAAFSHDGNRVVTASDDQSVRIWDWRRGRLLGAVMRHRAAVVTVQFSPDDARIVSASKDHSARVWDGTSGRPVTPPLRHDDSVVYAEFSADGQHVVTASTDSTARVWDARTGQPLGKPMHHMRVVSQAQFSPDGLRILTTSWDRTARLWDARTGEALGDAMVLGLQERAATFNRNGRRVFTVAQDGMVRAWDGQSGQPRGALLRLTSAEIAAADISADGTTMVTTSRGGGTQVWEQRATARWTDPLSQDNSFTFMRFSVDGRSVVTNSADHTATLWNAQTGRPLVPPLRHQSEVTSAEFSDDDAKVATTSQDETVHVWRTATGELLGVPIQAGRGLAQARFNAGGSLVLTISLDGTLRLFDASTGQAHGPALRSATANKNVVSVEFSPDRMMVAAAINDDTTHTGTVRVWNALTGDPLGVPMDHLTEINDWKFSPDGKRIATVAVLGGNAPGNRNVANAQILQVWDARSGAALGPPVQSSDPLSTLLEFSPEGSRIVLGTLSCHVRLWDGYTGAPIGGRSMMHDAGVTAAEFSPDGTKILSSSIDQTVRIWDAKSGELIGAPLHHDGVVWTAFFSHDGYRIVTASSDRTAQVWDANTHLALTGPMRHDWIVRSAEFSRDGTRIVTSAWHQNKMRIWPVLSASTDEALRLADLAEAVGGYRVDAHNMVVAIENREQTLQSVRAEFASHATYPSDVNRLSNELLRPDPP